MTTSDKIFELLGALVCMIPMLACIVIAGVLCYHGIEGWGWFIALTILAFTATKVSVDFTNPRKEKKDDSTE